VRAAVGANRARLIRQLLTERCCCRLLAALSGVAGLCRQFASSEMFGPDALPRLNEIGVDQRVLLFTFFASLLTGVVFRFGAGPASITRRI